MTDENNNEPQKKAVDDEVLREMEGVPEHLRDDADEAGDETPVEDALAKLKGDLETAMQDVLYARAETQSLVPIEYTGFLWASLFGWLFFREAVSVPTLIGAALIVAGCWIATRKSAEAAA